MKTAREWANESTWADLLRPRIKKNGQQVEVRVILDYNSRSDQVQSVLKHHWHILKSNYILRQILRDYPPITYCRSSNLRDMLIHSYFQMPRPGDSFGWRYPRWGNYKCGGCVACFNMLETDVFFNSDFKIRHHVTCITKGVVYFATCPCNKIYVGLTNRELRRRIGEHTHDIQIARDTTGIDGLKPIAKYFKSFHDCDETKLKVRGIDKVLIDIRGGNWKK